jgi:hypothetical protein
MRCAIPMSENLRYIHLVTLSVVRRLAVLLSRKSFAISRRSLEARCPTSFYIDFICTKKFIELCLKLEKKHGSWFTSPKLLIDMAAKAETFWHRKFSVAE